MLRESWESKNMNSIQQAWPSSSSFTVRSDKYTSFLLPYVLLVAEHCYMHRNLLNQPEGILYFLSLLVVERKRIACRRNI